MTEESSVQVRGPDDDPFRRKLLGRLLGYLPGLLDPRKSMQARLSLLAGGMALIMMFALAFWAADHTEARIKADQGKRMAEIAHYMATNLDRAMYNRKHEVQFFSSLIRLRDAKFDASEKRAVLNSIQKEHPIYTWIGMVDKSGQIIAGTGGLLEGVNVAQRDYFVQGRNGFFTGDVHDAFLLSKVLPRAAPDALPLRLVDLAAPIYGMDGQFVGILIAHMSMEWAQISRDELLHPIAKDERLDILVLKKNGKVLIGPNNDFVLRENPQDLACIQQLSLNPNSYSLAQWSDGKFLTGKVRSQGYGDFEGFGWQVMVRQPVTVAFSEASQMRWRILGIGSLAIVLLGMLGWRLVGYVVRPLRQIAAAAERIRHGDENIVIPVIQGQDEAAALSASLSKLVTGLHGANQELKAKVAEQVVTLEQVRKLSQAVEQNPNSIVITNLDGNIEYVNQAFVNNTGYSADEAIGRNPRFLHSGKTLKSTYEDLWATLTSGHTWKGEFTNQRKSGDEYVELALISPIRNDQGAVTHYLAIKEDISARKHLEAELDKHRTQLEQLVEVRTRALHESESRIRLVLESAAEAIYGIDIDGTCTFCNPACLKALGYSHVDDLTGKNMHDLMHHTHADGSPAPAEACRIYTPFRTGKPEHVDDELFWRKDGSSFPVEYWAHPKLKDGVVVGAVVTFFDITERKQAQQLLQERNNELLGLLEASRDIIGSKDVEQAMQQATDRVTEYSKLKSAAIYLLEDERLRLCATTPPLPPQFPEELRYAPLADHPHIQQAINTRQPVLLPDAATAELTQAERDVTVLRGLRTILYVPLISGTKVIGVLIECTVGGPRTLSNEEINLSRTFANLTVLSIENIRHYETVQNYSAELEQRIAAQSQTEQNLLAAKNAAEHANQAKDSFLATMSHEIRTPLGGLTGMLELLSLTPLDAEQSETLQTARDSGRSLLRILNDILDWSKIEEGKLELAPQATSMADLVAAVANTYSHVAGANSVTLSQQVDARLSPAHLVDPLRLSQVLNNFVSNAIKFTHGGRVELRAELVERIDDAEQVRFSVQDNGIGIAPEVQQRLFQQYGQASADTARMYGGTGLGLAICRRLADLMDGQIEVQSALGQGSTFSITLMLPMAATAAIAPAQSVAGAGAAALASPLPQAVLTADAPLVLVVDDNSINRKLMVRQLGLLGYRAESAENGELALAKWRAGGFALVITDCHMPKMDGYELARQIRASEAAQGLARAVREIEAAQGLARTPIFAWTANALADEIENCSAAGMDELLVKPAELVQLKTLLAKWLPAALPVMATPPAVVAPPAVIASAAQQSMTPGLAGLPRRDAPRNDEGAKPPALDVSVLAALVGDDPATIREFLQDFRLSAKASAAELLAACAAGDAVRVSAQAHKLKSAARAVGALGLGELCEQMEAAGQLGQTQILTDLAQRFVAEMAAVEAALSNGRVGS